MKVYLLVVVLLIGLSTPFRVLRKDVLGLDQLPDSISYLSSNQLVVQTGNIISIYNTQTHQVEQTYQSDQDSPDAQVSASSGQVLFKTNGSIFQMQQSNTPTVRSFATQSTHWVYGLGYSGNTFMVHEMSSDGSERVLRYLHTDSLNSSLFIQDDNNNNTVVAGSRVIALSPEEYYFVSGGICYNEKDEAAYYFYKGDSKGINNFVNLSVPNCIYNFLPDHKQEWQLSTIDTGNNNRLHAITYVLDEKFHPRVFTTQVLTSNTGFTSELSRFDTKRLIGVDFLQNNLYIADDLLCRVVKHNPDAYNSAVPSEGVLNFDMTSSVVSPDDSMVLALTGTATNYLLSTANETYTIVQTLTSPSGAAFSQAFFSNSSLLVLLDAASNLSIYDTADEQWSQTSWTGVLDFCVTPSNLIFSVSQQVDLKYLLTVSSAVVNGGGYDIQKISSLTLNWSFSDVMCLDSNSVLINPSTPGQPIAVWMYNNNTFTNTANLIKLQTKHSKAYTTGTAIFFTNPDKHSTPLFYDYNLVPIVLTDSLLLAPMSTYSLVPATSSYILFGVGYDDSQYVSIDQYQLFSGSLIYKGSYPLVNSSIASLSKVIVLPSSQKMSIQYLNPDNSRKTLTYDLTNPPQQLRGHFYSAGEDDCTGYSNAIFRLNPNNNALEMIVVNGIGDTPILERYSFSENSNDLTLISEATLSKFLFTKLTTELSEDGQSILIYGIKQSSTLLDTIQIRSANNIDDVTFEKSYFAETDPRDLQAYTLINTDIYTSIINSPSSTEHQSIVQNTPTSGGKISTGGSGNISFFATCGSCNFLAAVPSNNLNQILLVNIKSGVIKSTISVPCSISMVTLGYDGFKLAYLCSSTELYTFDTSSQKNILQGTGYLGVTSIKLLSATSLVLVEGGKVYNIQLQTQVTEEQAQVVEASRHRQLKATNKQIDNSAKSSSYKDYEATNNILVTISNSLGIYAYKAEPQRVQIDAFNGNSVQNFTLKTAEEINGLAFSPDNSLTITTNTSAMYILTTTPCSANSTEQDGVCVCDSTFMEDGLTCHCASFMFLQDGTCNCDDGSYYISSTQCGSCSSMCHTCSGEGVSNCNSYSAIFIVIIVVIFLLLAALGIFIFLKMQRTSKMDKIKSVARSHSKEQSSDLLVQEPMLKVKENS